MSRLLTTAEAAERLRTTARQVTILANKPDGIRASKVGRQWLISEEDLEDFIAAKANRPRRKRRQRAA